MNRKILLKSVSLREDLAVPERLAHYRPTRRSLPVVRAVLEGSATMVIAAYGSGKSLAAGVGSLLVLNDPDNYETLDVVLNRLESIDPAFHKIVRIQQQSRERGTIIVLTGYVRNVAETLAKSAGIGNPSRDISGTLKELSECSSSRIVIVWDEFGRHLEGLVSEGRARELHTLQQIAEWTARAKNPSASLVLLMHQNLLVYADSLNQTSRNEWKKVEGRFQHIRFVEDSSEHYELISEAVSEQRPNNSSRISRRQLNLIVNRAQADHWFDGIEDVARVNKILNDAYPMTAAALQALPRIIARLGQNERSLFNTIEEVELASIVGTIEIYDKFSDAMRSDVGIGGMYRRWLETENALSRARSVAEREALTAACLLQLGVNGERRRVSRSAIELAVASRGVGFKDAVRVIDSLIDRKLLIHRRPNDEVSVWHGADVDLAARIRDERSYREDSFDVVGFLEENHQAPCVRPTRHNAKQGTNRYLRGHYIDIQSLLSISDPRDLLRDNREWGRVYYVLSESAEDIESIKTRIEQEWAKIDVPIVFVLPDDPIPVKDAVLEVAATTALRRDDILLGEDPLVSQEIDELLSIARRHLVLVLHRLITDRPSATTWFYSGNQLAVTLDRPAGVIASDLMDSWYPMTPIISNDQLMRNKISRQMQTATVRVILRIMEHGHRAHLGYTSDDTSSEASVYRTILERNGIHYADNEYGRFSEPAQLRDSGLRLAWQLIAHYFREPQNDPKPLSYIVTALASRPIGLPFGVIPVLVMAGYRAFARSVSLCTDGHYVPDLLGFEAYNMFSEPKRHTVTVYETSEATERFLKDIAYIFAHRHASNDQELIRLAYDAINQWKTSLPGASLNSKRLSDEASMLLRILNENSNPADLILYKLPIAFGQDSNGNSFEQTIIIVERLRNEIDNLIEGYIDIAIGVIGEILVIEQDVDMLIGVGSWVRCLDVDSLLTRADLRLTDKAVLRTARDALSGRYSPQSFSRALSSILLQRGFDQWHDATVEQFRMLLRECRQRIEDTALTFQMPNTCMMPLVQARIETLQALIQQIRDNDQESTETSAREAQ